MSNTCELNTYLLHYCFCESVASNFKCKCQPWAVPLLSFNLFPTLMVRPWKWWWALPNQVTFAGSHCIAASASFHSQGVADSCMLECRAFCPRAIAGEATAATHSCPDVCTWLHLYLLQNGMQQVMSCTFYDVLGLLGAWLRTSLFFQIPESLRRDFWGPFTGCYWRPLWHSNLSMWHWLFLSH